MGVDVQGLATFVSEYFYWAPSQARRRGVRNAERQPRPGVADHPDRYVVCGATVPLQDVDMAIAEMDRVVANGAKGYRSVEPSTATTSTSRGSVPSGRRSPRRGCR